MLSRAISYLRWIRSLAAKLNALLNARSAVLHTSGLFKQEFQLLQNMHLWHQTSAICYLLLCFVLHPESMVFIEKCFHWKFILQLSAWAKVYRWPVLNTICMPNTDLQSVNEVDIFLWSWLLQRNNIQMCPLFRPKWKTPSASSTPEELFVGSCNWARKEKEPPEETDSFKECMIVHCIQTPVNVFSFSVVINVKRCWRCEEKAFQLQQQFVSTCTSLLQRSSCSAKGVFDVLFVVAEAE